MKSYNAPDAGGPVVPGGYGAPTPHAAVSAHEPYKAPEADLNVAAHSGWDMAENTPGWTDVDQGD